MDVRSNHDRVVPVHNLRDYFRTSIDDVIVKQGVDVDPHAAHYVVNLLTLFARSEEFYEDGETHGVRLPEGVRREADCHLRCLRERLQG